MPFEIGLLNRQRRRTGARRVVSSAGRPTTATAQGTHPNGQLRELFLAVARFTHRDASVRVINGVPRAISEA